MIHLGCQFFPVAPCDWECARGAASPRVKKNTIEAIEAIEGTVGETSILRKVTMGDCGP